MLKNGTEGFDFLTIIEREVMILTWNMGVQHIIEQLKIISFLKIFIYISTSLKYLKTHNSKNQCQNVKI